MIKLVVICRVFVSEYMINRWRVMAREYPELDITLLGHRRWESSEWGKASSCGMDDLEEERFHYHAVDFRDGWLVENGIVGLEGWLRLNRPDFVYMIGLETHPIALQIVNVKRKFLPNMKLALFTMRGLDFPKFSFLHPRRIGGLIRWSLIKKGLDAVFCHYPHGRDVIRDQMKFHKPIYMQTQVGVNREWFRPDPEARRRVRAKFGVKDDEYLFGTVCRILYYQKGIGDIISSLPLPEKAKFMFVGNGPDFERAKQDVESRGLGRQVIFAGITQLPDPVGRKDGVEYVQDYFNALDCFVLMSRTSPTYIDTYPLVLSQAMATSLPCVVSSSGALPYEVGDIGDVVPEKDPGALQKAMLRRFENQEEGRDQGRRLCERLQHTFEMRHLNRCFVTVMKDILAGRFNPDHADQTRFEFEAQVVES